MKIHLSSPLILLLLPALSAATSIKPSSSARPSTSRSYYDLTSRYVDTDSLSNNAAKGSQDVPVDGKDGRPHAGPWVETGAERDRKSAKNIDEIDLVSTNYDSKIPSSEHLSTEEGKLIPHFNGGVMDDPNRTGPREGTRGTEGGVSEKKEDFYTAEKVPGGPKEAPPLPHSEEQKLPSDSDSATGTGGRSSEGAGTLGMLEVRSHFAKQFPEIVILMVVYRSLPISPKSRTTSPTPSRPLKPRTTLLPLNMPRSARAQARIPARIRARRAPTDKPQPRRKPATACILSSFRSP